MRRIGIALVVVLAIAHPLLAQRGSDALSESEVEQIRDAADNPAGRLLVFIKIVDKRVDALHDLLGKKYERGRAGDISGLMRQINALANEVQLNVDDYVRTHKDVRKALPKLSAATEKWASVLRQVEKNEQWELTRQLALDTVNDLKKEADEELPNQQKWFKEHPPEKEPDSAPNR